MIRALLPSAVLLAVAACGGPKTAENAPPTAEQAPGPADQQVDLLPATGTSAAGEVVPGGAVDVLQREGWRVEQVA